MENKQKIFRDAVHGYISITNAYVSKLIDTFEMQRLKDVAQTGIRPIYSGATHERFSHSIGVYHIGTKIFSSLKNDLNKICKDKNIEISLETENNMEKYEQLYYIACILHDIGHPAFSHTFEYLYNNKYVNLNFGMSSCTFNEEFERVKEFIEKDNLADNTLEKALMASLGTDEKIRSQPHEMMSAYQILNSEEIQDRIKKCLNHFEYSLKSGDFEFIARMIIGLKYKLEKVDSADQKLDWSIRNCIIGLLNGVIDADSIDYLNRNSQVAGYDTYHLDVERICNAFSVYYDSSCGIFRPCFSKTALSALEGFVSARNYEPKWLYNHHKIVYYDEYLVKYLYKKCNRYLFAILSHSNNNDSWINKLCDKMSQEFQAIGIPCVPNSIDYSHYSKVYLDNLNGLSQNISKTIYNDLKKQNSIPTEINQAIQNVSHIDLNNEPIKKLCECSFELKEDLEQWNVYIGIYNDKRIQPIGLINSCEEIRGLTSYAFEKISNEYSKEKNIKKAIEVIQKCFAITKKYLDIYGAMREAFLVNGIAPIVQFDTSFFDMYKTSDSNISSIFKIMYLRYKELTYDMLSQYERKVGTEEEFVQFKKALVEFNTRQYRQSLWKSEYEYNLLIERIQSRTALPSSMIHRELLSLIGKGTPEEFEDPSSFQTNKKNLVYGNTGTAPKTFTNVFDIFGKGLVIKIYHIKYKDFGKLKIKFSDSIKNYEDLGFSLKKDADFPYIYYVEKNDDAPYKELQSEYPREDLLNIFEQRFVDYLLDKYGSKGDSKMTTNYIRNGKTIRDPIYGDIFIPQRFVGLIDTKVFQRLRRIKQLAVADYVFPEATHTRFSHSLGVFHIMNIMLEHFCSLFDWLNISYSQADKDAILAAALLHDIGHGPYSHAFEKALGKNHESWTEELILKDEELNNVITENFGPEFPKHIIRYLNYSKPHRLSSDVFSLEMVFSALINSQLDADRLDYLLRDAYNTGVKLGSIDLQKIITSMELTKYNGNICVCINEDALANIEQIILGRYNMYGKVYNSSYKIYAEELLDKIIKRIFSNKKNLERSTLLSKLYEYKHSGNFNHKDYIDLDDYKLYEEIHHCLSDDDPILGKMVSSFYNRTGYSRIRILDETTSSIEEFFKKLKSTFNLDLNCDGIIRAQKTYYAYDNSEDKCVLISKRNGTVSDITRESKIFASSSDNVLWLTTTGCVYINYDILKDEIPDLDLEAIKSFIASYDIRKHMEIEEKYSCTKKSLQEVKSYLDNVADIILNNRKYKIKSCSSSKIHLDEYYDSYDKLLAKNGYSLRCRSKDNSFVFTVKHSANENNGKNNGQFIRSEFEQISSTNDIFADEVKSFLNNNLGKFLQTQNRSIEDICQKSINIKNDRSSYFVTRENSDFCCELSLDNVSYEYNGQSSDDYQLEIELKSEHHIHKIELKNFAEALTMELKIQKLGNESESKYIKGLHQLQLL